MVSVELLTRIFKLAGAVTLKRTWRAEGKNVNRMVDLKEVENILKALDNGWVISFPQGTTSAFAQGRKGTAKIYIISSIIGLAFVAGYKFFFIDVFNQNYVNKFLEIGLKPTSLLVKEFFLAIGTSFNPFIHILNPNGGILNVGILGIGFLNIIFFIKVFTVFTDEFWSSKIVGILCYLFMVFFAWKKKFYWRESLLVGALFSMISLFAATLSETLFLPFLFVFLYVARNVLLEKYSKILSVFLLSLSVILLFNIRYRGLIIVTGKQIGRAHV